ncbi:hypothetical protein AB0M39_26625 [Streptomyces sp. NPDC051907]|uniref:hypothetical protein n=1 Tax=Streptomyces sp. NPDC051907 TaxID=3155284 RepID=UPI003420BA37
MTIGGQDPYRPTRQPNGGHQPYPPHQGHYPPNPGPYPPHPGPYAPYVPNQRPYPPQPPASLWRRLREDEWPTTREMLGHARRIHGCVWALLFPCFGSLLLTVLVTYPLARSARIKSRVVFPVNSQRRAHDDEVARLQKTRAWIALAASVLILLAYGTAEDWQQAQDQFMVRWAMTPLLLLISAPMVVAVLFWYARPSSRADMRSRLRPAVRSVLWYFGALAVAPAYIAMTLLLGGGVEENAVGVLLTVGLLVPMLWVALFVVFSTRAAVRTAFNTTDVHPALPALLTGVLVWEFAVVSLAMGGLPPGPPLVQFLAVLGGPASVSAVAWWEIVRLRTRYGVTLRG